MGNLKVLSLNCFGIPISFNRKTRFREIAKAILTTQPNIAMLQEAIFTSDRKIIQEALENDGYKSYPSDNINLKNGGLMTFVKGIKVESFVFYRFKNQGAKTLLTLPDRVLGKGFHFLKTNFNGERLDVINAHFVCRYGDTPKDRLGYGYQMAELLEFIDKNNGSSLILGGDINVRPNSEDILELKSRLHLIDSLKDESYTIFPTNLNRGRLMNTYNDSNPFRTDYILFGEKAKVLKAGVIYTEPVILGSKRYHLSDHFGILAEAAI